LSDKLLVWEESLGSSSESEEIEIFELEEEAEALGREAEEEDFVEEPGFAPESVFLRLPRVDLGLSEAARAHLLGFGTLFEVLHGDAIEVGSSGS
jgi:hypothetical protein